MSYTDLKDSRIWRSEVILAYSELIKSFERIRDYMREFYVYGFRRRNEFTGKSARSYDDERRRVESWLGGYMGFRQTPEGKSVFLSIDSRLSAHNPLYQAWKAKSFTAGDITLHFLIFDLLADPKSPLTLAELTDGIDRRLAGAPAPKAFDESTLRKKLKEYADEGLIIIEKSGRLARYRRAEAAPLPDSAALDFFSEAAPVGVIGSFLLDKLPAHPDWLAFKHHYITGALDSEILANLFEAMQRQRSVQLTTLNRRGSSGAFRAVPLRIFISVQSGRQYLMGYLPGARRFSSVRLDNILSVKAGAKYTGFAQRRQELERIQPYLWGVSTERGTRQPEQVDFTIRYGCHEEFIPRRLEREKRCGQVERLDGHTCRFTASVYDSGELLPWIRTFICRITSIRFSNPAIQARFDSDLSAMYRLYGLDEGGPQ